jgi:threonylcarbamoyladenosine tRNA methylthiotransferase MtaB
VTVEVITFGCRLNSCESELIREAAATAELDQTVIVNTCAVTSEAVRQARQAIRALARNRPEMKIVVTGCAAQTAPASFAAMAEVDRVLGNDEKMRPAAWTETRRALTHTAGASAHDKIHLSDIMVAREVSTGAIASHAGKVRVPVQIQNGCDHRCTFCIIPFGRGNSRSLPATAVIDWVRQLVEGGCREVVLTGVDLTSYGVKLPDAPTLGRLVKEILANVPGLARLRLSSIDSAEADDELLDAMATESRLMPHLHLSLQSGDDLVLKRMKRRHSRAGAIAFCERVRRLRPEIVFGADMIAGFPTETDAMFRRSLDLVEECGLTHLHVFPFSLRPDTPAARMPQVRPEVIKERARELREKGAAALQRHLDGEVGSQRSVLAESSIVARTERFTPVRLHAATTPGTIFDVPITGHDGRQLLTG